jgi:hypothetical protein
MVNKNSKTVKLKGGLGNQLFQYSFALFLRKKFDTEINLEISWYKEQDFRKFELNNLLLNNEFSLIESAPSYLNNKINNCFFSEKLVTFLIKRNYYLPLNFFDGYWQEIFFASFLKNINLFKPDLLKKKINNGYYVIHIRRGDFLKSKAHLVLSDEYYLKYVDFFRDKKLYIISEDEEHAVNLKNKIKFDSEYYKCDALEAFNVIYNACGGISSNSTFCWWPIFLSENRNWFMPHQWLKAINIIDHNLALPKTIII